MHELCEDAPLGAAVARTEVHDFSFGALSDGLGLVMDM